MTQTGGRIVMGNWIPGDPTLVAQVLRISGAYSPPPPEGFVSPVTWGDAATVEERFTAAGIPSGNISCVRATYNFEMPVPPQELLSVFRYYYGPTVNAFAAADAAGRADELQGELGTLFESQNESGSPGSTSIPATFLLVTVMR